MEEDDYMALPTFIDPTMAPYVATFLFIFGVVFGLLSYAGTGGDEKKNKLSFGTRVNAIIALAFAIFSLFYPPLVTGLQQFLPIAVIILLVLFFIVFLKRIFDKEKGDSLPIMVSMGIMLVVLTIAGDELLGSILPSGFDLNNVMWIVGVVLVIMFFWAAYNHKPA